MLAFCRDRVCGVGRVDVSTFAESSGKPEKDCNHFGRLFVVGRIVRRKGLHGAEYRERVRELYATTYNKYRQFLKGSIVTNSIEVEQKGNTLYGKSRFLVKIRTNDEMPEIIL